MQIEASKAMFVRPWRPMEHGCLGVPFTQKGCVLHTYLNEL